MKVYRLPLLVFCASTIIGCSQIAVVSEKHPGRLPAGVDQTRAAAQAVNRGLAVENQQPLVALGQYVFAAQKSLDELNRNPKSSDALHSYNFAIARMFGVIRDAKLDPWTKPLKVGANREFTLTWKRDPRPEWNLALYNLVPADELIITGTYVKDRVIKEGIGAPMVAERAMRPEDSARLFCPPYLFYSITATAQFDGSRCVISANDPLAVDSVRVKGHLYPLAADYTASYALLLAREKPQKLGIVRLIRPEAYANTFRVARLEPYDPKKTPVLVIHGLMDTPVTWVPMLNEMRKDPFIRHNYQFWFFSYPSGYPYPYSAMVLRKELDGVEKAFPARKKMVVIGHSMGGCISRTLVTDAGMTLWMKAFGKPPEQLKLPPDNKQILKDTLIFNHRPEIGRVIFMSAPHRGSILASNWIGRLAAKLVRAPGRLLTLQPIIQQTLATEPTALQLNRLPNSIDTLAPNNRFVMAINQLPISRDVAYHTIVGDRGRGDTPNSSDGVVAYWSSHLDGAQSEFIAPSDHSTPLNPQAIAEVHRILKSAITRK